jgi:hypothetical protein
MKALALTPALVFFLLKLLPTGVFIKEYFGEDKPPAAACLETVGCLRKKKHNSCNHIRPPP